MLGLCHNAVGIIKHGNFGTQRVSHTVGNFFKTFKSFTVYKAFTALGTHIARYIFYYNKARTSDFV